MDRRLENASSDFVASIIYFGEDRLNKGVDQGFGMFFKTLVDQEKKLMVEHKLRNNIKRSFTRNHTINMDMMNLIIQKARTNNFKKTFNMMVDDDSSSFERVDNEISI